MVQKILKQAESRLRAGALSCEDQADVNTPTTDALRTLADSKELGPDSEGLCRILYFLDKEVIRFITPGQTGRIAKSVDGRINSKHLRIPVQSLALRESFELWMALLRKELQADLPLMMIFASEYSWMDLIIGDPTSLQLYCLRAPLENIPLTSSIPYPMDKNFIDGIQKKLNFDLCKNI
jgi:hypothetical protein